MGVETVCDTDIGFHGIEDQSRRCELLEKLLSWTFIPIQSTIGRVYCKAPPSGSTTKVDNRGKWFVELRGKTYLR